MIGRSPKGNVDDAGTGRRVPKENRRHWSRTQSTRALSTAEADCYAIVTGAAEALGMQSMVTDLGLNAQVRVWKDSNAAKVIAPRRGFGKTRHAELKCLWLQEVTKSGRVKTWREIEELVRGVGGRTNVIKSGEDAGSKGAGWRGSSEFLVDSEIPAGRKAKQHRAVSVRSVVHEVAGRTQHQSGSACRQQQWCQKQRRARVDSSR